MNQLIKTALQYLGPVAASLAMSVLKTVLNNAYRSFWIMMFQAVRVAEKRYIDDESKNGVARRKWVVDQVVIFAKEHKRMNFLQKFYFKKLIGYIVDLMLKKLNTSAAGHQWIEVVKDMEEFFNEQIKIIEPLESEIS